MEGADSGDGGVGAGLLRQPSERSAHPAHRVHARRSGRTARSRWRCPKTMMTGFLRCRQALLPCQPRLRLADTLWVLRRTKRKNRNLRLFQFRIHAS